MFVVDAVMFVARDIGYSTYLNQQEVWRRMCEAVRQGKLFAYVLTHDRYGHSVSHAADPAFFAGMQTHSYLDADQEQLLRTRDGEKLRGRLIFFKRDLEEAFGVRASARHAGGAPAKYNWDDLREECLRLMGHHGEFSTDDPEWDGPAKLEKALSEFHEQKYGKRVPHGTLYPRMTEWLEEWRGEWR